MVCRMRARAQTWKRRGKEGGNRKTSCFRHSESGSHTVRLTSASRHWISPELSDIYFKRTWLRGDGGSCTMPLQSKAESLVQRGFLFCNSASIIRWRTGPLVLFKSLPFMKTAGIPRIPASLPSLKSRYISRCIEGSFMSLLNRSRSSPRSVASARNLASFNCLWFSRSLWW